MFSILLVEDEKLELETLRDYVDWKKLGISEVYTARNGKTALECMEEHEPDIMITDVQMPVMNGIELSKRIRDEGYACRIVFLSGYDDFEYAKSAFQVRAVDYILKPFRVDEVEALVLRIKDELEKEKILQSSLLIAERQFLQQVCCGETEYAEASAKKFFDCGYHEKKFGLLAVFGCVDDTYVDLLCDLPEVVNVFVYDQMICVLLKGYISFLDAAGRIVERIEKDGSVAWFKEKISLQELPQYVNGLSDYQDEMFYRKQGEIIEAVIPVEEVKEEIDREKFLSNREALRRCIATGKRDEAEELLFQCLQEFRKGSRKDCQREAYGLYLYLHNRLELEDALLLDAMEKRKEKPEQKILEAGFYRQVWLWIWDYVETMCEFFHKQQEDPNYFVYVWVKDYIEKNYAGVCSVEEMAEGIKMSPNYLRSRFKNAYGQTILEYLTEFRLQKACELLMDKTLKVKDVSQMTGYENISYFSQVFVKKYGVTPNEYRKMV